MSSVGDGADKVIVTIGGYEGAINAALKSFHRSLDADSARSSVNLKNGVLLDPHIPSIPVEPNVVISRSSENDDDPSY
jgi:hypothetical protein